MNSLPQLGLGLGWRSEIAGLVTIWRWWREVPILLMIRLVRPGDVP